MKLASFQVTSGCKCPEKLLIVSDDPIRSENRYTPPSSAESCTAVECTLEAQQSTRQLAEAMQYL
jgi:hypothetical protein